VIGLTSAACILFSETIGIAMSLSQYVLASGGTLLGILTLRLIGRWETRLTNTTANKSRSS